MQRESQNPKEKKTDPLFLSLVVIRIIAFSASITMDCYCFPLELIEGLFRLRQELRRLGP